MSSDKYYMPFSVLKYFQFFVLWFFASTNDMILSQIFNLLLFHNLHKANLSSKINRFKKKTFQEEIKAFKKWKQHLSGLTFIRNAESWIFNDQGNIRNGGVEKLQKWYNILLPFGTSCLSSDVIPKTCMKWKHVSGGYITTTTYVL